MPSGKKQVSKKTARPLKAPGDSPGTANYVRAAEVIVIKDVNAVAIVAGTAATIWTPATGKKFRLMGWSLSTTVGAALIFRYGAVPTTMFRTPLLAAAQTDRNPDLGYGNAPGAVNDALKLDVTVGTTVSGFVFGVED